MNDVYEQQLVHELAVHAQTEAPDLSLVDRLLERAAARRRRRRTVVASVTAAVVVAVAVAAGAGTALYRADRHTPPAKDHRPDTALVRIAYAVNGSPQQDGTWPRTVIQLPAPGSARITLPEHWEVIALKPGGAGLVAQVYIAKTPGPTRLNAYIAPDGTVRRLQHLDPESIPLTADGSTWVSAASGLRMVNGRPQAIGVDLVQPATDTVVGTRTDVSLTAMVGAVHGDTLVTSMDAGHVRLWPLTGSAARGHVVDIHGTPWTLMGITADGRFLLRAPRQLHLLDASGHELWAWDRPDNLRWDYDAASLSPSGRYVVARFTDGYAVLETAGGTLLGGDAGVHTGLTPLAWEDDHTLVVTEGLIGGPLQRCDVVTGRCSRLDVPDAPELNLPNDDVVFAGS